MIYRFLLFLVLLSGMVWLFISVLKYLKEHEIWVFRAKVEKGRAKGWQSANKRVKEILKEK